MKVMHSRRSKTSPMGTMPTATKDAEGNKKMIESLEATFALLGNYLANEYSATLDEQVRPDKQVLEDHHFEWLDGATIDAAFAALKAHKAPGWDMLTKETIARVPALKERLNRLMR